jgi:hypothetical protein
MKFKELLKTLSFCKKKLNNSLENSPYLSKQLNSNGNTKQARGYLKVWQGHELLSHKTLSLHNS